MSQVVYTCNFNNFEISTIAGVTVLAADAFKPPRRNIVTGLLSRANKIRTNSAFYTEKYITVRVNIVRNTRDLAETTFDTLMTQLQGIEKNLILAESGTLRQWTATFYDINWLVSGGSYLEFELVFLATDMFGYDLAATLLLNIVGFTSAQRSDGLTFGGTAPWQAPVITISYSVVTTGTNKNVVIGNSNTSQQITITRTWVAGDVLVIDCLNKTVKVNGTEVAFTGAIPEWAPGFGYWNYSDTFAARTFNGQITNVNRSL